VFERFTDRARIGAEHVVLGVLRLRRRN